MKAIKFAEPWKVDCVDQAMPEPKEGEALIKIHCAAVCGSDIGAFRGTNGLVSYPRVIGHELSGEIVSIPSDPAQNPKGLKVGDRVEENQVLITIEAMKMETAITARMSGTVDKILISEGDTVKGGQLLLTIK